MLGLMRQRFLERLGARDETIPADRAALVVAHPDDETLALGAQLPRLEGLVLVHVTDGAPRNRFDETRQGFATWQDYAAARRRELETAVALGGLTADALIALAVPDQEASLAMPAIARRLAGVFQARGVETVLTHAYEGGHPDHDAVAFCVHAARRLLAARGQPRFGVIEMPFYHADASGWVRQRFIPEPGCPETVLRLSEPERALKRRMLAAHATQAETLSSFSLEEERFRPAPDHDFTSLPNGGELLYERYGWGMTGARWRELVRDALAELWLEARACA
jgi:LmbE family N-acetylglucosaminyl deacetylase